MISGVWPTQTFLYDSFSLGSLLTLWRSHSCLTTHRCCCILLATQIPWKGSTGPSVWPLGHISFLPPHWLKSTSTSSGKGYKKRWMATLDEWSKRISLKKWQLSCHMTGFVKNRWQRCGKWVIRGSILFLFGLGNRIESKGLIYSGFLRSIPTWSNKAHFLTTQKL